MYAVLTTSRLKDSLHYKNFIKEVYDNREKYKVNTMGVIFAFKIESLEDCVELFNLIHKETKMFITQYRISKSACMYEEYIDY